MNRPLTSLDDANTTRERIMLEASMMFARRGYAAVSMRDIAERVGVSHPSIYSHFENKEALYDAILENIKAVYMTYYTRLDGEVMRAEGFVQMLDCLFAEVIDVYDMYIYYGFCLIATEQFRDEKAADAFNNVLVRLGIDYCRARFDECVARDWVKPFDTEAMATMFHNSVVMGTLMRTHEDMGRQTPYDVREMFIGLKRLILGAVEVIS